MTTSYSINQDIEKGKNIAKELLELVKDKSISKLERAQYYKEYLDISSGIYKMQRLIQN